jgi:hypothetical protein
MRWRTFERLAAKHDALVGRSLQAMMLKFADSEIFRSEATGRGPCYGTIVSAALAAVARPQTSLIVSPKTFSSASIDRVPSKIVGIDVGISGFPFNISSWYLA